MAMRKISHPVISLKKKKKKSICGQDPAEQSLNFQRAEAGEFLPPYRQDRTPLTVVIFVQTEVGTVNDFQMSLQCSRHKKSGNEFLSALF